MDTEAIRVTAREAARRRDAGFPRPCADGGLVGVRGGVPGGAQRPASARRGGADLDHPVHRHFLWGRQRDAYTGCRVEVLQGLGELIASGE